jgi:stage V sporulation protein AF
VVGLLTGFLLWILLLAGTKSLETPYFWPLLPFHGRALMHVLFRPPVAWSSKRSPILHPQDRTRR